MRSRYFPFCAILLTFSIAISKPAWSQQVEEFQQLRGLGKKLFEREWSPQDSLSPKGDGLGPMFNARSCAACHPKGGGAPRKHNVQLISLRRLGGKKSHQRELPPEIRQEIPFFAAGGEMTVILHRESTDEAYNHQRRELLGLNPPPNIPQKRLRLWENARAKRMSKLPLTRVLKRFDDFELILSERNTPALFGGKLIENISPDHLHAAALRQNRKQDGISGRVSIAGNGQIGKFGWRGQNSSLPGFVRGACAAELGLQSQFSHQSINPFKPASSVDGIDVGESEIEALAFFVQSIPRPVFKSVEKLSRIGQRGHQLFHRVDCAQCHIENLGGVRGLYSDLLLHDMGRGLADPMPAMPEMKFFENQVTFNDHGYFGAGSFTVIERTSRRVLTTNILQEWRTPPLWGVADSAPYLHDGRATTLVDAIRLHGGEAKRSVEKFARLSRADQNALIAFLKSLTVF